MSRLNDDSMPQLYGHRYLGPGNPADNGEPIDRDDEIAREHDREYESATEPAHIRASDLKAIGAFGTDFVSTGNWHSAVGALGLVTKYSVETLTGTLYPSKTELNKRKRENETTPSKMDNQPPEKRQRTDGQQSSSTTSTGALLGSTAGGTGSGATVSGSGASEHTGVALSATSSFKTGKLVFRHNRMMYSYGYQFKSFKSKYSTSEGEAESLTCTPYANVPVDCLPWYMTPGEFDNLPITSSVKHCATVITPMGYRTPFITNSAGINSVNSNLLVFGMYAHGLHNRFNGGCVTIKSDPSNPMYPTECSIDPKEGCSHEMWWGKSIGQETSINFDNIHSGFGNMKPFTTYYAQALDMKQGAPPLPELHQALNIFPMVNGIGNTPILWEYRPQVNVLKPGVVYAPLRDNHGTASTVINFGQKILGQSKWNVDYTGHGQNAKILSKTTINSSAASVPYDSYIEHAGTLSHGFVEYAGGVRPPSLHVGVMPVHAYSTDIKDSTVQEVVAIYKVETEITIEYSFDFTHTYDSYLPPNLMTFADNDGLKIGAYPHWFNGYRSVFTYG